MLCCPDSPECSALCACSYFALAPTCPALYLPCCSAPFLCHSTLAAPHAQPCGPALPASSPARLPRCSEGPLPPLPPLPLLPLRPLLQLYPAACVHRQCNNNPAHNCPPLFTSIYLGAASCVAHQLWDKSTDGTINFANVQANAEPDLQQTGDRLKPVVEGLVEGIMHLVVDPLAHSQVTPPSSAPPLSSVLHPLLSGAEDLCCFLVHRLDVHSLLPLRCLSQGLQGLKIVTLQSRVKVALCPISTVCSRQGCRQENLMHEASQVDIELLPTTSWGHGISYHVYSNLQDTKFRIKQLIAQGASSVTTRFALLLTCTGWLSHAFDY